NALAARICREALGLQTELQDKRAVSEALAILGMIECSQGNMERATRLFGSAQMLLEQLNTQIPASHRGYYEARIAAARGGLGDEAFASGWAVGQGMTMEQALADALQEDGEP